MDLFDKALAETYEHFNNFMFCDDTKIFGKLIARTLLFSYVKDVPGDIVECGVFKGTGVLTFLKLKKLLCQNSIKRVIGFDFFDSDKLIDTLSGNDKEQMETLFTNRGFQHNSAFANDLHQKILNSGFSEADFELIEGDIRKTAYDFIAERVGFKISLLYLDLDLEQPTFSALDAFWDRVSKGGVVVFDEYAYHKWSESVGVDRFFADKNVNIKILNYICPTAYVVK